MCMYTYYSSISVGSLPNIVVFFFLTGVLQEFCDTGGFSDASDMNELSDDEHQDPTFQLQPRLNEGEMADEDSSDEEPIVENINQAEPTGSWTVEDEFFPLPPAPEFEDQNAALEYVSSISSFKNFIPNNLIDSIAEATRINIFRETGKELSLTREDIEKFFGVTIMMSYLKYPRIRMYWGAKTKVPAICNAMTRSKYFLIRNYFRVRHYANVTMEEKVSKYWKVQPLLETIRDACLQHTRSNKVAIDEQIVPFWGHTQMRQVIRGKPNPCGLKNFVACSPDGLPLDFFLYEGKGDTIIPNEELNYEGLDVGGKVIVRLTKHLPQGITIYMDRYFNSILLLDELHLRGFQGTGTLVLARVPKNAPLYSDAELRGGGRGYVNQVVRDDGQISVVKWFDNKPVILASSIHGKDPVDKCRRWSKQQKIYVEVNRPSIVKEYNDSMGGVDLLDRIISYYRINARTRKWTVRLIFHMVDFAVASGWILRRRYDSQEQTPKRDRFDYLEYRADLSHHLLNAIEEIEEEDDFGVAALGHPGTSKTHVPLPHDALRKCSAKHMPQILDAKEHRCRFPGCTSKKARMQCSTCKVFLCLNSNRNCFKVFHEM